MNVRGPMAPPPRPPPPPGPPAGGVAPAGGAPATTLESIEICLSSWVMFQVTLSAFIIPCERPWLFALSRDQAPAKLAGAKALAATAAKPNAVINPAIKNNLLI